MRFPVRCTFAPLILALASCTGGDRLGEPTGSPMQFSTALPVNPAAPRDLCMFDGVNGRVLTWSDLTRLVRRTDVIVFGGEGGPADESVRKALADDAQAAFPPVAVLDGCAERTRARSGRPRPRRRDHPRRAGSRGVVEREAL